MTLYWWSHWFWITLLGNVLFLSTTVHTYPSSDISLDYNQMTVTKLYETATTLKWDEDASPTSPQIMDLASSRLSKKAKDKAGMISGEVKDPADNIEDDSHNKIKQEKEEYDEDTPTDIEEFEHKRSAEMEEAKKQEKLEKPKNYTQESAIQISKKPTITMTEDDSWGTKETDIELPTVNDHRNLTSNIDNLSTNKTENNNSSTVTIVQKSPPSAPSIDAKPAAVEWLKTAVVQFSPPASQRHLDEISSNFVTTSYDPQKVPFTLENVNREDELRRAESEHRTRKSKVLSAEYKHINRYINFSSDPRSLLTRSASASPNDFDNDSESNISSEALAVPRTYFLDAGAISAICFTIFGVCCTVGTIGLVLYRRRYLNKPQTLSEPDSSVYIDDSTMRVSDNSDEMYSLDNDSFLNSLEAMTIQNYWTDTVKHTKL